MVRRKHARLRVFEVLLPDGDKLWDPALRRIDEVLGCDRRGKRESTRRTTHGATTVTDGLVASF
jgi:hypothetical protein